MAFFRKYGWIAWILLITDTLLLYLTDSRCLFHFLSFAPLEIFQQNYPRFGWLVWALAKIHWPLLVGISLWYSLATVMNLKNGWREPFFLLSIFLEQLPPKYKPAIQSIYQKINSISGNYSVSLSAQFAISFFLVVVFSDWYFSIENRLDSFQQQLSISHWLIRALLLQLCIVLFLSRNRLKEFVTTFFAKKASPLNLAIFRIVIGYNLSGVYSGFMDHHSYWAGFPQHMRVSLPYMDWFIQNAPISPYLYHWAGVFGLVAAKCIMFGFLTRPMLLINIALGVYIIGVPMFFGKLFHMHIWVWFPLLLAFSRCADVLSIDWLIRKLRGQQIDAAPHAKYQLPLTLIWLQLGLIYFFAGYVKLNECGLAWALSNSMINQVQVEWAQWYNKVPAIRIDHYPFLLHLGGLLVILFEIYFPFLVLSSWGRVVAFAGGLSMHQFIGYFMYIEFKDLQYTYAAFIGWDKLLKPSTWFKRPNESESYTTSLSQLFSNHSYKLVFLTGAGLLSINFYFGLNRVHSWPFSSYPTYSSIVLAERDYIYFEAYDKQKKLLPVYDLGEKAGFRMESFTPVEESIYKNVQNNDSTSMQINVQRLWNIWASNVPMLKQADSVAVYLRKSPVAPERVNELLVNKYLMSIKF